MPAPPSPPDEEASSSRQEETNMPVPPPSDPQVSKDVGEAPPQHQEDRSCGKTTPEDGDGYKVVTKKTTKHSSPPGGLGRGAPSGNSRQTSRPSPPGAAGSAANSSGPKEGGKAGSSAPNREQRSAVSKPNITPIKINNQAKRTWKNK